MAYALDLNESARACAADKKSWPVGISETTVYPYCACMAAQEALTASFDEPLKRASLAKAAEACAKAVATEGPSNPPPKDAQAPSQPGPPETQSVEIPSTLTATAFKDVLVAARNKSTLPHDLAERAILACVKTSRSKFPKSSNSYVAGTCACVVARADLKPNDIKQGHIPTSVLTDCGTTSLSRLNRASDVFGSLKEEMLASCSSNPEKFGAASPKEASQICSCVLDEMIRTSRPQVVMWRHLGLEKIINTPMSKATATCKDRLSATVNAYPFAGDWYQRRHACPQGEEVVGEDKVVITARKMVGYEFACEARDIRKTGDVFTAQSKCDSDGQQWSESESFQIVDAGTLKMTSHGKSTLFYKCQ